MTWSRIERVPPVSGGLAIISMLITDERGKRMASAVNGSTWAFDSTWSLEQWDRLPEFEATKALGYSKSRPKAEWLRSLRGAKVEAIRSALHVHERVLFLDADTYVCASLRQIVCALEPPAVAAFVPVDRGREHGAALLKGRWRVPAEAREANTGVLAFRNGTEALRLVDAWQRAYTGINFFMDQPAFRVALHATQAPHNLLPFLYNCRGHQRRQSGKHRVVGHVTAVPLRCSGFDELHGEVQVRLKGGMGCVILHSHDIREP